MRSLSHQIISLTLHFVMESGRPESNFIAMARQNSLQSFRGSSIAIVHTLGTSSDSSSNSNTYSNNMRLRRRAIGYDRFASMGDAQSPCWSRSPVRLPPLPQLFPIAARPPNAARRSLQLGSFAFHSKIWHDPPNTSKGRRR